MKNIMMELIEQRGKDIESSRVAIENDAERQAESEWIEPASWKKINGQHSSYWD